MLRELKYFSGLLQPLGVAVSVAFSESSVADIGALREYRACLYAMEDAGITVLLSGLPNRKFDAHRRSVLQERIFGLTVTPGLLGLGEPHGAYDPLTFEAAMEWIGKAVHEHRKMVVVEDVSTAWQLDVIRAMPFYAFSGSVSRSLVFV